VLSDLMARSTKMVPSPDLAALRVHGALYPIGSLMCFGILGPAGSLVWLGTLAGHGCALKKWYSPMFWLRSRLLVLSDCVAALSIDEILWINGSLRLIGTLGGDGSL